MEKDFTTLAGVKAVATELKDEAAALGLEMDFVIDCTGNAKVNIWTRPNGAWNLEWYKYEDSTADGCQALYSKTKEWLSKYKETRKERLAEKAAKLEAELDVVRGWIAEAEKEASDER